ncbi:unnamed protein product [Callosobruchus maculatus]|uniref:ubiquitinyl hydrolase 1 n=1 Tax=Callosobruchus maculatus TaxID=64391 RepID=A0A653D4G5_CALMS|nr:unnamed protein product [Callosobruchus maculatus]
MIDKKVIPLYIADSLAALDALAQKEDIFKYLKKTHKFASIASKMKVELLLCREDQEKCYILAKRYVLLMDHIFKISDDPKYTHALYLKDYNTVKELMNVLRSDLEERYQSLSDALHDKLSISKRPRAPFSNSTPSGASSIVNETDYILPTGEPDPLLAAERAIELDLEPPVREIRSPPQVSPNASREIFIAPKQLYEKITKEELILLVDIRLAQEYQQCKIKIKGTDNMINITPELIAPGLSANTLGRKLPPEIKNIWEKRDKYDSIIMFDYDTDRFNYPSSKLERLRSFITEWDFNRTYKQLPVILDGGIKEFVEWYPSEVDNPRFLYLKTNAEIDELLDLDTVAYPGSGTGVHRNLRVDSTYSMGDLEMRINRDFADEEGPDEDALRLRNIRSEGALPRDSYQLKDPGVAGPFSSISEESLHKDYKEENINPAASTDFMKPQDQLSPEDSKVIRDIMASEQEELLQKARLFKPVIFPDNWTEEGFPEAPAKETTSPSTDGTTFISPPPPSFDRSFKPATVMRKPDYEGKRDGFTGIQNYKNSCFMSCILQCMKVVPMIKDFYVQTNKYVINNRRVPPVFNIVMGQIFKKLWEGTEDNPKIYHPQMLRDKISRVNTMYEKGSHEDAFEFFLFFFDQLSQDCIVDMPRPPVMTESEKAWYSALQGRSSQLIDSFFYQLENTKICFRCKKKSSYFETEGTLNLSMRTTEPCKLEDLLDDYMADYLVSDFSCQQCKCTMTIINKRRIVVDPEVLVIALKRYIVTPEGAIKKHEGEVMFPDNGLRFGRSLYKLYAVAQHVGGIAHGHYFATCLLDPARDDWIEFNDETMTRINTRPLQDPVAMRTSAVGFFYVRQETLDDPVKDD